MKNNISFQFKIQLNYKHYNSNQQRVSEIHYFKKGFFTHTFELNYIYIYIYIHIFIKYKIEFRPG